MSLDVASTPFGGYDRSGPGPDECFSADGSVRDHWVRTAEVLEALGLPELLSRGIDADRLLDDDGVSYRIHDSDAALRWRLDPVPVVIPSADWAVIEGAMIQRAVLLDLVLRDLYGPRQLLSRGLVPPEIVFGHPGFLRSCDGMPTGPDDHELFGYAADLGRDGTGAVHVLSDRTQAPSGAGYALANRLVVSRVFPSLYRDSQVHRIAPYFRSLRAALERRAARIEADSPRIVLLSPGPRSETAFEHAYLASYLGYSLVEPSDLTVSGGRLYLRALGRLERVHVVLRRVDAAYCDPLELYPESQLGVPGLVEACRRGSVAVVNPLGAGVLENPALPAFLPEVSLALLGQDLELPSVPTWWCGDDTGRSHVLANLDRLVVKPISPSAGSHSRFGAEMAAAELGELTARIEAEPHLWVGQEPLALATVPTLTTGGLEPRRGILRAFAVTRGESYAVMAGALSRVEPAIGERRISNQAGAPSKDTWVLASEPEGIVDVSLRAGPTVGAIEPAASLPARAAENLFWLGRYAERAEAATRLLRVVHTRHNDFRHGWSSEGHASVRVLLEALTTVTATHPGFLGPGADAMVEAPDAELLSLACEVGRPGTLAFSVRRMLGAAEAVRDQLSLDTWLVVGSLDRDLAELAAGPGDRSTVVGGTLGRVMQHLLALHGLAGESMVRDPGWYFLDVGRRIERSIQLVSLLRSVLCVERDAPIDALLLESVLVAGESIVTSRRRYRSGADLRTLLDLLVADPINPRSLRYQVDRLGEGVAAIPGGGLAGRLTAEERIVLGLSTDVRVADTADLARAGTTGFRDGLAVFLDQTFVQLQSLSDALDERNFERLLPQRPLALRPAAT